MLLPPLALYIHIPWCVRKCPYCDFNSHTAPDVLPEDLYVTALLQQLERHLPLLEGRSLNSIFFGGGTPSLFSAQAIANILLGIAKRISFIQEIEISLEANPGTIDQANFCAYPLAGINRISLGIQSWQNDKLKTLGRIHQREHAIRAVEAVKESGITNFNLDLMFGLPAQTMTEAITDIQIAIDCQPTHLSWYQLTIEPNTVFYKQRPTLPNDETLWEMQLAGQTLLAQHGYQQYEVSAYAQPQRECRHNKNYWEFGDYLGLGAGAHSKITDTEGYVTRFSQAKQPKDYLDQDKHQEKNLTRISNQNLVFEFMLNALRLTNGVSIDLFTARTGLPLSSIQTTLKQAQECGLLLKDDKRLCATELGQRFLNNLVEMFLPT